MALLEQTHRQDPAVTGAAVAKVDAVGKEAEVHQDQKAQKIPGGASGEGERHVTLHPKPAQRGRYRGVA